MKKALCILLALLMVFSMFLVSCAKDPEKTTEGGGGQQNQTTADDTSGKFTAEVKKLNRDLTIIRRERSGSSWHLGITEIYAEAVNGDKVNDAVFSRNSQLLDQFGITVKEIADEDAHKTYREALIAGEYVGDVFAEGLSALRTLASANLLVDWASLQNIDLEKDWWNHNLVNDVTIAGKSFFITGDCLTLDDRGTWALYVNNDLIANAGLESVYKLVDAGTWTSDKMYEYMQATAQDLDSDGVYNINKDVIGYGGEKFNNMVHVCAGNVTVSTRTADGKLEIPDQPKQELLDAWAEIKPVMTSPLRYTNSGSTAFRNNLQTFCGCNLGVILKWGDAELNFGVIPYPKLSVEQQGYYTTGSYAQLGAFGLPTTVEADPSKDWTANGFTSAAEQVAYMVEAFSYLSMTTVTPAFYDQVLMKQTLRDTESQKYLAMTLNPDSIVLDPVMLFNFGKIGYSIFYDGTPTDSVMADDLSWDNFVSNYSARVEAARTALVEYETITSVVA